MEAERKRGASDACHEIIPETTPRAARSPFRRSDFDPGW